MANRALLVTNNPLYMNAVPKNVELRFVDGSALDVLIAARDLAHAGWTLANHPLYGNFTPRQQPYRSIALLSPDSDIATLLNSGEACTPLGFLENALALYQGTARKSRPEDLPEHMRRDCAVIDRELLRATLDSLS